MDLILNVLSEKEEKLMNLTNKVAYLKGIAEGSSLTDGTNAKFYEALIATLEELSGSVEELEDNFAELEEYVTSIDEDLSDLEEEFFGDLDWDDVEDEEFDLESLDDDDDDK